MKNTLFLKKRIKNSINNMFEITGFSNYENSLLKKESKNNCMKGYLNI